MAKGTTHALKAVPASVIASYQVTSARRLQYENLMWQVPALSLSAQAVLISVTLSSDTSASNRLVTSILSAMVGFISIQLLQKHRYHEVLESKQLEKIESLYKLMPLHAPVEQRARQLRHARGTIESLSGFKVWRNALLIFSLTGLGMTLVSLFEVFRGNV